MTRLCNKCGRVLPQDNDYIICDSCRWTEGMTFEHHVCPVCGKKLEVWYKNVITFAPTMEIELIYHCERCGSDWLSCYLDDEQTPLQRKFWG